MAAEWSSVYQGPPRPDRVKVARAIERSMLTNRDLGHRVGVSEASVSHWRHGERTPGQVNLCRLASALGVSSLDLLEES